MNYVNPVIRGFYPDPSVCRANGKYYLVCSSMHYFPSIPLFESEDLVNWNQIGWCLTRKSQINLEGVPSSGGIFAPTIRYHDGRFFVVTTDDSRHRNFYVYTDDIYGEWSDPIDVDQGGIDPSLYFEEDRVYFTSNGRDENHVPCIYQCEIEISTGRKLTESRIIWRGSGGRLVEGPHLYKIEDYYYLLAAEGGTEYGHMVTYARGETPYGPFDGYPGNPVLTNRNLGDDEIQGVGHGDLIQDWDGNWWLLHLGFRQMALWKQYHHLGREVFLTPVYWDGEGWFRAGDRGIAEKEVSVQAVKKEIHQNFCKQVDFSREHWDEQWSYIRNPVQECYEIEKNRLRIRASSCSLRDVGSPSFLGIRQREFTGSLTVCVKPGYGEAGVSIYMDENHHYDLAVRCGGDGMEYVSRICIGGMMDEQCRAADMADMAESADAADRETSVRMEIQFFRDHYLMTVKAGDIICLERQMAGKYLSSEVAGGFTGVFFGLYAYDYEDGKQWSEFTDLKLVFSDGKEDVNQQQ